MVDLATITTLPVYGWSELTAVRDGRYKFIAAPRRELYDTQNDPGETRDVSSALRRAVNLLVQSLDPCVAWNAELVEETAKIAWLVALRKQPPPE